jgi:phosphopantothenoylcysteine decarboxylase/phosphopantothenate--cysteine ligase
MGYALATAAHELGADVVLISGPNNLPNPSGITCERVETTQEMYEAVQRHFGSVDCLIMAAAPADFTPVNTHVEKVKKSPAGLNVELKPTIDILKAIAPHKRTHQRVIGFALETNDGIANARNKLVEKQLDMIVLNSMSDPGAGFDTDTNKVTILRPDSDPLDVPLQSKSELSRYLLEIIARIL